MLLYALPESMRRRLLDTARRTVLAAAHAVKLTDVLPTYHRTAQETGRSALLAYRPVTTERTIVTTATAECQEIIQAMNERGFDVTLLSCSDTINVGAGPFELVFGFGAPFRSAARGAAEAPRILYCTEGPPSLARAREEAAKERVRLLVGRTVPTIQRHSKLYLPEDIAAASHLIVLGDDIERWRDCSADKPVFPLLPTGFAPIVTSDELISSTSTRELVWMGSAGAINKGLDIAFAVADRCGASVLHLLGLNRRETGLLNALRRVYPRLAVRDHGFLPYSRETFGPIALAVDAALLPSASEAAPTGCLTLCRNGVPAVISDNCGLSAVYPGIFVGHSFDEMAQRVSELFTLHPDDRAELRLATFRHANARFALPAFGHAVRAIFSSLAAA